MNGNFLSLEDVLPDLPQFDDDIWETCRKSGDYRRILFEYYRNVAILVVICASIDAQSPAWAGRSKRYHIVQTGLLTRVHRILAGHLEFFQNDRYGDLTLILDRCLLETCVKIRWIAMDHSEGNLRRFFEDSLKIDSELLASIRLNISDRGGEVLAIEHRMLASIQRNCELAGFDIDDAERFKRAPPLSAMVELIGERRYVYTVIGKIASHSVHGSWANLLSCYIEGDGLDDLMPRSNFSAPNVNQYAFNTLFVLDACRDYVESSFVDGVEKATLLGLFSEYQREVKEIFSEAIGGDFDAA